MVRVLLIEDNKPMVRALSRGLNEEGFAVDIAIDGDEGDSKARAARHDVIILDLMAPKVDGPQLVHRWRRAGLSSPVLILATHNDLEDKVVGADDFLTKPFQFEDLLARLRTLVRRGQFKKRLLRIYDLEIDTATREVKRAGQPIQLTPQEFALLQFLTLHQGRVVTRSMIWEHLYNDQEEKTSNVVDVYIRYLRNKIDKGFEPALILTRWGEGYLLRGP